MDVLLRRSFLKTAAGVAGLGTMIASPFSKAFAESPDSSGKLEAFPLHSVRLAAGIFQEEEQINARYLDSLTVDRLLHSFRSTAGLASSATPYKGWEDPTCELRGHFAGGHYLSAVALASAGSGNDVLKRRGDELISGLAECQKKMGTGYVSAYPPELFQRLVDGKPAWAPFYTYHKIMAGLLDMYVLTGNADALRIAEGMAGWVGSYLQGISAGQQQRMLRTEYGGMNEVLVNLAALTKKERYISLAHLFEQPGFLDPLAARSDELQGLHANTQVPKIIGAARMYEVTGDRRYRQIAEYFLEEVLAARSYVSGNSSLDEHWKSAPGHLEGTLGWKNAECCVAYNMIKLQRLVFGWTGDARWMDAYERTLFNSRLGTQNAQGLKRYFFPLAAGYWRAYNSPDESFWCCTGTGAENFAKFADTIYFRRGGDIYVNQFLASTLEWNEEGLTLRQITQFPHEQGTALKVELARPGTRTIHVRIPRWTTGEAEVQVNGHALEAVADPGSYLAIRRVWQTGDTIRVKLPMELRQEALPGDSSVNAVLYGPLAIAANLGAGPVDSPARVVHGRGTEPKNLPAPDPLPKVAATPEAKVDQWVQIESAPELRFSVDGESGKYPLMPMYQVRDERYSLYWQMQSRKKQS